MNPNIPNNTYFFSSNSNPKFNDYLINHLPKNPHSSVDWYEKNQTSPLHCTLGFYFGQPGQSSDGMIKKLVAKELQNFPHAMHLKVEDCAITPNGWVILKFKENKKLKDLHQRILNVMISSGLKPSHFSGANFLAHVSIGKLKPNGDQQKALVEVQHVCQALKGTPFPFIAFDLHLSKKVNQQDKQLVHKKLDRQDIGIQKVNHVGVNKIVEFAAKQKAERFTKILAEHYNIKSAKQPGPKIVKSNGTIHTVFLTQQQFDMTKGHFNNLA